MVQEHDGTDPNFPIGGLNISPSYRHNQKDENHSQEWRRDNEDDIRQFGIAGRIWEATYLLIKYLSRNTEEVGFDPPCSLFDFSKSRHIVELGAGAGVVGIHLALQLAKEDTLGCKSSIVLTDLDNVLPLLDRNIARSDLNSQNNVVITSAALPWGSQSHAIALQKSLAEKRITHIICSDLVYFPELLTPLLRTLVHLTNEVSSPEVIIGYKLRSYTKEEAFWKAFGIWFDFSPVLCKEKGEKELRRFGSHAKDTAQFEIANGDVPAEDEMFIFIAHRKASTAVCVMPANDEEFLGGWILRDGNMTRGEGGETFELLLMNAMQDS